jgi:hypothetical protein
MPKESVPTFKKNKFGEQIDSDAPTNPKALTRNKINDLNFIKNTLTEIKGLIGNIKESDNLRTGFAKLCKSISGMIGKLKEKGFIRNYEEQNREFFNLRIEFLSQIVDFSINKIEQNKEITKISETFKSNFRAKTPNKIALLRKEILETQFEKDTKTDLQNKIDTIETKFGEFLKQNTKPS